MLVRLIRASALLGAALALLVGCGPARAQPPRTHPTTPVVSTPPPQPAEYAGGACQLLDFDVVRTSTGLEFDVSAASQSGSSYTCVLQGEDNSYPDLRFMLTAANFTTTQFRTDIQPHGASTLSGLGTAAYTAVLTGDSGGPAVEVGWLSGNGRVTVLRVTLPRGAAAAEAKALLPKVTDLARKIAMMSS